VKIAVLAQSKPGANGSGGAGADTAIAIGTDGLAVIAFRDESKQALSLARCSDAECSRASITQLIAYCTDPTCQATIKTVVGGQGQLPGYANSIVVDADGRISIVYNGKVPTNLQDFDTSDVYLVRCDDVACTRGSWGAVNKEPRKHAEPTIAIINAKPVIAFREQDAGAEAGQRRLMVVRCEDAACSKQSEAETIDSAGRAGYSPTILGLGNNKPAIAYGAVTTGELKFAVAP
jgi:hypothetical protein